MKSCLQVLLVVTLGLFFLSGCSGDDDNQSQQTLDMRINHYQGTGTGEGLFLIYLVQKGEDIGADSWSNFYSSIEGFNYEPGYIYDLSVTVEHVDNPPPDGSSNAYTLKEIISKEKVDKETLFHVYLKLNGQSFITGNSGSDYKILNQVMIDCNEFCEELNQNIQDQHNVTGIFKHLPNSEIQLVGFE